MCKDCGCEEANDIHHHHGHVELSAKTGAGMGAWIDHLLAL